MTLDERDHWDELFDEVYLRTYSDKLGEVDSAGEAAAAAALAGVVPPAEILDAPCGFGRHAIPLAESGFRVTGVDRSAVQLEEARRRAGEAEWPRWVQADFRDLPFEAESFDAVLALFTPIGYRGEEGDREMLTEFLRVLRPGGTVLIETLHRDRLASIFQARSWDPLPDGGIVAEERRFDLAAGEVETDHILVTGGERRSITFRLRAYTATDVVRLLTDVGFGAIECFGDLEGNELSIETRLTVRARKPS